MDPSGESTSQYPEEAQGKGRKPPPNSLDRPQTKPYSLGTAPPPRQDPRIAGHTPKPRDSHQAKGSATSDLGENPRSRPATPDLEPRPSDLGLSSPRSSVQTPDPALHHPRSRAHTPDPCLTTPNQCTQPLNSSTPSQFEGTKGAGPWKSRVGTQL